MVKTDVIEVFSSLQGEGIYTGRRQIFIRFAGCNLTCYYCDTADSRNIPEHALIEQHTGRRDFKKFENPVSVKEIAEAIMLLDTPRLHDSISLTGGEPLLHTKFIQELSVYCGDRRLYLETNGSLPRAMAEVAPYVHIVAMDIKIESASGAKADLETARQFLLAAKGTNVFVKVIVTATSQPAEIDAAAGVIESIDRNIPLVIQPVSAIPNGTMSDGTMTVGTIPPDAKTLLILQEAALARLPDVRIIPQIHRLMGWK